MPPTPLSSHVPLIRNPFAELKLLLPGTAVVLYALLRHKLTPLGGLAATSTALLHIACPADLPFVSLIAFFLVGTIATRVGKAAKSGLTISANGGGGAEGARNAVQVFANSGTASLFIVVSILAQYLNLPTLRELINPRSVVFGIACSYAAAAADTLSSELGILAKSSPFMIVPPFRRVPKGTNGGVTIEGLAAGLVGSSVLAVLHFAACRNVMEAVVIAVLGLGGSVLDSILGAVVQATVEDKKSGRVVEGTNGRRVLVFKQGSRVRRGFDLLNNNGVNFAMTLSIGLAGLLLHPKMNQ